MGNNIDDLGATLFGTRVLHFPLGESEQSKWVGTVEASFIRRRTNIRTVNSPGCGCSSASYSTKWRRYAATVIHLEPPRETGLLAGTTRGRLFRFRKKSLRRTRRAAWPSGKSLSANAFRVSLVRLAISQICPGDRYF